MENLIKYLNEKVDELKKLHDEVKQNSSIEHMIKIVKDAKEEVEDEENMYSEPPAELLAEFKREKQRIASDYEEMAADLDETDEHLTTAEKLNYLKQNEMRHAQWQYLNLK